MFCMKYIKYHYITSVLCLFKFYLKYDINKATKLFEVFTYIKYDIIEETLFFVDFYL